MKSTRLAVATVLLLSLAILAPSIFVPKAHAGELELFLEAPKIAHPGETIDIGLWTVFNNDTAAGGTSSLLAYNATNANCKTIFPCISLLVKANLNATIPKSTTSVVVPHIHTPSGAFVPLPSFKQWVHPGAWMTTYVVPSEPGLYGVHVYANFTTGPGVSFVYQAATTFSVQAAPAQASSLTTTQYLTYAVLGAAALAVVLDIIILTRKRTPSVPK